MGAKRIFLNGCAWSAVFFVAAVLLSCSNGAEKAEGEVSKNRVVKVKNLGRSLAFEKAPERAVALNQHTTEMMLALGLEDSMVGTAYLDDQVLPELQEGYKQVPVLSDQYPSQEVFLSVEPDFAYAGWKSAFREDHVGTMKELKSFGIHAYLHQASNVTNPTVEDVFQDISNIGRIFRVESKADDLIHSMKKEMKQTQSKVGEVDQPIRVFVYDSGETAPFTAGGNFLSHLITLAGGENIFSDIEKNWTEVNWEAVVDRNPEMIVIMDYGDVTVSQKRNILLNHPALADVDAIKNERFVVLPLSAGAPGIRAPDTLETLAKHFYPEKFKEK